MAFRDDPVHNLFGHVIITVDNRGGAEGVVGRDGAAKSPSDVKVARAANIRAE
jgi:hypothetical protein